MNAKQLAGNTVVAIAIVASMPVALANDEHHEGERPEASPGLVRDIRLATQEFPEQWDAANAAPPVLGGQLFHYVGAPNRLRLPAYYELHVWAWKRNPNGIFSDWNPRVSCVEYAGEAADQSSGH